MPLAPLVSTPSFGSHAGPSPPAPSSDELRELRPRLEDRLIGLCRGRGNQQHDCREKTHDVGLRELQVPV